MHNKKYCKKCDKKTFIDIIIFSLKGLVISKTHCRPFYWWTKYIDEQIVMTKIAMQTFCDTTQNSISDKTEILKLQENQKIKLGKNYFFVNNKTFTSNYEKLENWNSKIATKNKKSKWEKTNKQKSNLDKNQKQKKYTKLTWNRDTTQNTKYGQTKKSNFFYCL